MRSTDVAGGLLSVPLYLACKHGEHDAQTIHSFPSSDSKSLMPLPAVRCDLCTPSSEEGLVVRDACSAVGRRRDREGYSCGC